MIAGWTTRCASTRRSALLAGVDPWHTAEVPPAGLPALRCTSTGRPGCAARRGRGRRRRRSPAAPRSARRATPSSSSEVGGRSGARRGARAPTSLLAPTVNLHRTPIGGRNFECYCARTRSSRRASPSPTSRGVQSERRGRVRQALRRQRHRVRAHDDLARSTSARCASCTSCRSRPPCSTRPARAFGDGGVQPAQRHVLRASTAAARSTCCATTWGFDGVVICDWFGTHSTAARCEAGLDLEMPGPPIARGERLLEAVRGRRGARPTTSSAAGCSRRLLRRCGRRAPTPGTDERAREDPARRADPPRRRRRHGAAEERRAARCSRSPRARAGSPSSGPYARGGAAQGGGSAALAAERIVTPEDGLAARGVDLVVEPGVLVAPHAPRAARGRAAGAPRRRRHRRPRGGPGPQLDLHRPDAAGLRLQATLTPDRRRRLDGRPHRERPGPAVGRRRARRGRPGARSRAARCSATAAARPAGPSRCGRACP